ncbi:MAG: MlaD family protein [Desulfosarcinaceae bacterium]|nr:MlaD family protein [Desulfosarcinaceae bacterium]
MSTDDPTLQAEAGALPEVKVHTKRHISPIWLIPVIALCVGIWLAYTALSERGPAITITFKQAAGLEAGKTLLRYKDVEIGKVEKIRLSPDLSHVTVTARMVKGVAPYLTDSARFWIVRARVMAGEVSGLDTLFSGVYIGLEPGQPGLAKRVFIGLERPPVVSIDTPGRRFRLVADRLGSLDVGSPVYYRQIKVGQVVSYQMRSSGEAVEILAFIEAPHDQLVRLNTKFWNTSGLDVRIDTEGVRINTESVLSLLLGGISFETPTNLNPGRPALESDLFRLHKNQSETDDPTYAYKEYFVLYFNQNIRGLKVGAPVEFSGIKIGEVVDIRLEFDETDLDFRIPVLIAVEPERVEVKGSPHLERDRVMKALVEKGLRAQLRTGMLLTGQQYVNLEMYPDLPPITLVRSGLYSELPTVPNPIEEITASAQKLLNTFNRFPLEAIGSDLQQTLAQLKSLTGDRQISETLASLRAGMANLERFTGGLNQELGPRLISAVDRLEIAIAETGQLLQDVDGVVDPEGPLIYQLTRTLKEMTQAARAVETMADTIERQPNALIFGKESP